MRPTLGISDTLKNLRQTFSNERFEVHFTHRSN
jgi:hypothetical protein